MTDLSRLDARRIVLAAQGFAKARPKKVTNKHLLDVVDTLGGVQVDAVNVMARAHLMTFFSRVGPYNERLLWDLWEPGGGLIEYWMHGTCLMRYENWPNFAWRMRTKPHKHYAADLPETQQGIAHLQREVDLRGEVTAQELEERTKPKEPWWDWTVTKTRLELMVRQGSISTARKQNFERTYISLFEALPDDIVEARDAMNTEASKRACVLMAAKALGVASVRDIRYYVWMGAAEVRAIVKQLVADGELVDVKVEGIKTPHVMAPDAPKPNPIDAASLVNPFDPLMWERDRFRDILGMDYVLEIFIPEAKRQYGYYVMPFLLGEEFVARVDLKADRKNKHLLVQGSYAEFGIDQDEVASALMHELREVARWQGLDDVVVKKKGDFAKKLTAAR